MTPPTKRGVARRRETLSGSWRLPLLCVLIIPILAYLPQALGLASCNPIYGHRGLVAHLPQALLAGRCSLDGNDGSTLQALGGRAAAEWLAGRLPWWNTYAGLGLPLAAEAQPAAFFLPFVLVLHFIWGIVFLKLAMQMLSGAFALACFREMGLGRVGATGGAIAFSLNGTFAWFGHSMMLPIAFLPALVFGIERSFRLARAGRPGGQVSIALALAFSILAGFPETAFMDGLLAALWSAVLLARARGFAAVLAGKVALGGLLGLALAAPAWVSFLDYLSVSSIGAHVFVGLDHLEPGQAATLLLPGLFGPPYRDMAMMAWSDDGGYFGPCLALLGLMGLFAARRHAGLRYALGGWIAFWLAAFFGEPVTHAIWSALPVLNEVQITRYGMPSLEFAAAALAAIAIDDWRRRAPVAGARVAGACVLALAALLCALAYGKGRLTPGVAGNVLYAGVAVAEAACAGTAVVWLLRRRAARPGAIVLLAVIALDAAAHFMLPELAGPPPDRLALAPLRYLRAHAGLQRFYALGEQIPVNYASWFGIPAIQADTVPAAWQWVHAAQAIASDIDEGTQGGRYWSLAEQAAAFRAHRDTLARAAVRFLVVPVKDDPFINNRDQGVAEVFSTPGTRIYEMAGAAPYFATDGGGCTLGAQSQTRLVAQCAGPSVLVRHELAAPGWRARINGHPAAITTSSGLFQQIQLQPGENRITWRYVPPHANLMAALFLAGLLGTCALLRIGAGKARGFAPRLGRGDPTGA